MVPDARPESGPKALFVTKTMFPGIGVPARNLEHDTLHDITGHISWYFWR